MKPEHSEAYENAVKAGMPIFEVLSDGAVKGYTGEDGKRRFKVIASSNATDLVNDVMTPKALEVMQEAAKGTTMFMNHKYNVPEDVFGAVEKATLVRRSVQVDGETQSLLCLDYDGIVEETNPRAVAIHDIMLAGRTKLGASVSVLILNKNEDKAGRRLIEDVQYLEASIVGIPCNPTCWVMSASKALKTRGKTADLPSEPVDIKELTAKKPEAKPQPEPDTKHVTEDKVREMIDDADEYKGVIGATNLPLAERSRAWAAGGAKKRMKSAAGGDKPNSKYKRGFFWVDSEAADQYGSYKLPFADVIGGTLKAVPRGIFAVAGVLQGSRGGVSIPDADKSRIKTKVGAYYSRMRKEFSDETIIPPWDKKGYDFRSSFYAKLYEVDGELELTCPHCKSTDCELKVVLKPTDKGPVEEEWGRCRACKGLFLEMMDKMGLSFDMVISCFIDCLWELREEKWDGEDYGVIAQELEIAIDEFADCVRENAPKWIGIYTTAEETEKLFVASRAEIIKSLLGSLVTKAGARNNVTDQATIQSIHDAALDLGAACQDNKSADSDQPHQATDATDQKVASLTSELQVEQTKVADLTASNKAKEKEIERWKAAAVFAAAELERLAREPLPRAGQR